MIELYPYQKVGAEFLRSHSHCYLADEMGCVAHSTKIKISRGGATREFTIEEAYRRFNNTELVHKGHGWCRETPTYIQSWLGDRYGLNEVKKILRSGIKKVIGIKIDRHEELKLTEDHEVYTKRGWVAAGKLKATDTVAVHLLTKHQAKPSKRKPYKPRYNNLKVGEYHPYAHNARCPRGTPIKRVERHRVVYESYINGLSVKEFQKATYDKKISSNLKFVDPKKYHIHHKDHDCKNDVIENLEKMTPEDHYKYHTKGYENFNHGKMFWRSLRKIDKKSYGKEVVYDIVCADPHRNFVANGILVHNCGKTPQAIDACRDLEKILVVCPVTAKINWQREFKKFSGRHAYVAGSHIKKQKPSSIVITNYERIIIDMDKYKKVDWDVIVFDEAHFAKSVDTQRSYELFSKIGIIHHSKRVWCLSGTPAPNNIGEMWIVLRTFGRTELSYEGFVERYCTSIPVKIYNKKTRSSFIRHKTTGTNMNMMHEIKPMFDDFLLRRKLLDVHKDMPPITYSTVEINPDYDPLKDFPELKNKVKKELDILMENLGIDLRKGSDEKILAQLSLIADSISSLRRYHGLKKASGVAEIIKQELENNAYKKIVIFAVHTDVIDMLMKKLGKFNPVKLTGKTTSKKKQEAIDTFQNDEKCRIFVGNIHSAGTAITLTAANQVACIEWDYVPGNNAQAIARVWRLSQIMPVWCRLFSLPGFDDRITQINERKIREINSFMS